LEKEMIAAADLVKGRPVATVFLGGGTPSVMEIPQMEQILHVVNREFSLLPDVEFTMEANPGTLDPDKLRLYRAYGVNRLSLGLQSACEEELKMLGRIHTFEDFLDSYHLAREAGFTNINIDLMSAIPGQTRERWQENLRCVAALNPEHISAYSLIVEEGTPFYERELDLPDEDTEYEMYEDTGRILGEYGYRQYEISNYAREGFACRHNEGYWTGVEYLGLGLGAASLLDGRRFSNTRVMEEYLKDAQNPWLLHREEQVLSERDKMEEFMFLGLRMSAGVSETEFYRRFQRPLMEVYGDILLRYERTGHLLHQGGRWRFSTRGIHVSNWILADFVEVPDGSEDESYRQGPAG
jgi:oxygen-independent coproporphyrinogen-3 oxidase